MYYDKNSGTFRCYVKVSSNPVQYDWQTCGGGTLGQPPEMLKVPVKIYDQSGTKLVLEINEE